MTTLTGSVDLYDMQNVGLDWYAWVAYQQGKIYYNVEPNVNFVFTTRTEDDEEYVSSCVRVETGASLPVPPYLHVKDAVGYYRYLAVSEVGVERAGYIRETKKGLN